LAVGLALWWFEVNVSLAEAWQQLCDQTCEENAMVYKAVGHFATVFALWFPMSNVELWNP
jgi:hypothetical protein